MVIKEHLIVIRDEQGELVQIFSNNKKATEKDIERCLRQTGGRTAFLDVMYRLGEEDELDTVEQDGDRQ